MSTPHDGPDPRPPSGSAASRVGDLADSVDQYLWDGGGTPDADVRAMEQALAPLHHKGRAPAMVDLERRARSMRIMLRAAAILVLGALGVWSAFWVVQWYSRPSPWAMPGPGPTPAPLPPPGTPIFNDGNVTVFATAGTPRVGVLSSNNGVRITPISLGKGESISVRLSTGAIITASEGASIEFVSTGRTAISTQVVAGRVTLDCGAQADPMLFAFAGGQGTGQLAPGSRATLVLESNQPPHVDVEQGWGEIRGGGRVLAGMRLDAPNEGLRRLPVRTNVEKAFEVALADLEGLRMKKAYPGKSTEALDAVLKSAARGDAATLWNLLSIAPEWERPSIAKKLAEFVPPPADDVVKSVIELDERALDAWWDAIVTATPGAAPGAQK